MPRGNVSLVSGESAITRVQSVFFHPGIPRLSSLRARGEQLQRARRVVNEMFRVCEIKRLPPSSVYDRMFPRLDRSRRLLCSYRETVVAVALGGVIFRSQIKFVGIPFTSRMEIIPCVTKVILFSLRRISPYPDRIKAGYSADAQRYARCTPAFSRSRGM